MCSGPIFLPSLLNSTLSKYLKLPEVTLTAPTLSRHLQIVDAVEIDQPLQRLLQRRGVVIALRLRVARRPQRRRWNPRGKETGDAEGGDQGGAGLVENRASAVGFDDRVPRHRCRHHLPEFLQARHAFVRLIAGDDRGIDGADRNPGDPFRLETRMTQRLEGAGLIGAERAAALQDQYTLRVRRRPCGGGNGTIHHVHRADIKSNCTVASVHDDVNQRS